MNVEPRLTSVEISQTVGQDLALESRAKAYMVSDFISESTKALNFCGFLHPTFPMVSWSRVKCLFLLYVFRKQGITRQRRYNTWNHI